MNKTTRKNAIIRAMTGIECYPIIQEEVEIKEYTKVSMGQLTALGATFASIAPAFQDVMNNSVAGEPLYRMVIPNGVHGVINSVGNITNASGKIVGRARFIKTNATTIGTVAKINPSTMLMAVAISTITKKLDKLEEAQKDIIEFLQLKEKAVLKGNIAVLQEVLDEYKYNWDNEKYKNNKYIQIQEIKRDAEQSIIFCREKIEKKVAKKAFLHNDSDVRGKIKKVQYEFKDYELAMYIFAFSSFMEVMLLENFDSGYLNSITKKIELYLGQYRELHQKCYDLIKGDSKTTVRAYLLKGVAGINKALGKGISKIPKISEGRVDEALISAGEKVDCYSERQTEITMDLFAKGECSCVCPFVENINVVNKIYNEPMELLFDKENVYFLLAEPKK